MVRPRTFFRPWREFSGFDQGYRLETFEPMVREVFSRKAYDPAVLQDGVVTDLPRHLQSREGWFEADLRLCPHARQRNHTIADLQALKGTGRALTMSNPANPEELQACVDAGIDLFVVGAKQMEDVRRIAPTHFTGAGSTWAQFGSYDEIVGHAFDAMRRGADMYYSNSNNAHLVSHG